jgi:hypothetical protein
MLGRSTFAALILAAAVSSASGLEALLGDAFITLPPPAGFCDLTPRYEFDGSMVANFSGLLKKAGIRLLAMSADCGQLSEARAGRRRLFDDVVQYQTRIATVDKPPAESVAQTCTTLRAQGDAILANRVDLNARIESAIKEIKIDETHFIGVLAEDANACYAGVIQKARTEVGTDKTQITMWGVTIVRNRSIAVYRYAVYQNPDTVKAVLSKLKRDVAALIAANP